MPRRPHNSLLSEHGPPPVKRRQTSLTAPNAPPPRSSILYQCLRAPLTARPSSHIHHYPRLQRGLLHSPLLSTQKLLLPQMSQPLSETIGTY